MPETQLLAAALAAYALAALLAVPAAGVPRRIDTTRAQSSALLALAVAVALHTLALAWRWRELGHGPFTTMHEILSSNLWSLALVFAIAAWRIAVLRGAMLLAVPVWAVLAAWLWMADAGAGHLPPTYATPLLYLHTVLGKLYLGLLLAAVALGGVNALRRSAFTPPSATAASSSPR